MSPRGGGPGNRSGRSGPGRHTGGGRPLGGGGGGGYGGGTRHTGGDSSCSMSLPVAVLGTLFYALPRMAFESWRGRR